MPTSWQRPPFTQAMKDLEERVAVRYGEAKEYTERFREIQDSMSPREQVAAMDAAQSALSQKAVQL